MEICGHHLHATPVPPSVPLGRPIPPRLESVILSCLEKSRERRPSTARALIRAFDACDDVERWTEEQARSWWAEHGRADPGTVPAAESLGTLTPSLELRDVGLSPRRS